MRRKKITNYPVLRNFFYRKPIVKKQEDKNIFLQLIPLFSLLISLCSIFIAYKSVKLSATEKGAETEAKVVSDLTQTDDWKNISVSVQNVSNTQIGINSAYVLVYEIVGNSINYKGILKNKRISFTRLEPFANQYDTLREVFGAEITSTIPEENTNSFILEFRIYYSRLFDGKIYGARSFYATEGEPNLKYYLFKNEESIKRQIEFLNHSPQMLKDFPDYVVARNNDIFKINLMNKLKSEKFLRDSLILQKGLDFYPPLDQPYLSPNTQYDIDLKN